MTIDIIDLTQEEYASLNEIQLAMVRTAQAQKNAILARAAAKKQAELLRFLKNGTARSSVRGDRNAEIDAAATDEILTVKEDLLYQLTCVTNFSTGSDGTVYRYPDNPNYNLNASQRFLAVRSYYMDVTSDPDARLEAYAMDTLARSYLGEYYQTLYELLASYC